MGDFGAGGGSGPEHRLACPTAAPVTATQPRQYSSWLNDTGLVEAARAAKHSRHGALLTGTLA